MAQNKCSILVTSCDAYDDAWEPFFTLLKIMWPECKLPIYLNTESKSFDFDDWNITALHPQALFDKKGQPISWSRRLTDAVRQIESDYILFFLEDFFLMSPVREDIVFRCVEYMENHPDVGIVDFYREPHDDAVVMDEFSYTSRTFDYAVNAMAAIWRKSFLLEIIRDENPWDFEFFATRRWWKTDWKIITHRKEFPPVFDYKIKPALGYGIFQGKWLRKNPELFEKYGITVDFEKRGFVDPPNMEAREREKNWLLHDFGKVIRHPGQLGHYAKCFVAVSKDKVRRFRAKHFNK